MKTIKTKQYRLYNDDFFQVQDKIKPNSISLVLCDLPYGTTRCSWDITIPFEKLWNFYRQVIKPNSAVLLFGSQPFTSLMILSNISSFREELIWVKNKAPSGLLANKRHLKIHENVILFCNQTKYTYNPIKWIIDSEDFLVKRKTFEYLETNRIIGNKNRNRVKSKDDGSRNPISILPFKIPYSPKQNSNTKNGDYRLHPTQKPLALLEYLIKTYSNENDIVLDNCMGSGSTGIACLNTGRRFIGIEKEAKYFDIAVNRIQNHKPKLNLLGN